MGAWLQSQTFWLDLTNIGLGLATVAGLLVVGYGVTLELLHLTRVRHATRDDDHVMLTPDLGLTMADGGRRISGPKRLPSSRRGPR